ncbi:MAG: BfmA/BtgA family mobilization protein [Eubacteriales bacterium]|nr:BfmA/BtgA family mobilization protein [Eubacteriales bacterium]
MTLNKQKSALTSIGIDKSTNRLIDKLCKRYNLKKGEIVRLAFAYIDKASINPSEPPESAKAELAKINKRQDDLIRFIRHFEEEQLNPMIRATNSIAVKFETIVKELGELLANEINTSRELQDNVLKKVSEAFNQHAGVINNHAKQINGLSQMQQRSTKKLLKLIQLYSELSACGVMDGKRKESLKNEIIDLIDED